MEGKPKQDAMNVTFFKMALTLVRFCCKLIGMVDNSEIMTEEQKTQNAVVETAIRNAKLAVALGQARISGNYTFTILFKMLLTKKNDKGVALQPEDLANIANAIRNLTASVVESIEDVNLKPLVSRQLLALKETVAKEASDLDALQTQLLALPPTTAVATSNAAPTSNAAAVVPRVAPATNRGRVTNYFQPVNANANANARPRAASPGGAGNGGRSRRRVQKSKRGAKHGGRSRMRKMRTKKRRMSRRKIRR
jgi:hypothetical protein